MIGSSGASAWAASFGQIVDTMEISPDGASLRPNSRFAKFTNLPELQQLFKSDPASASAGSLASWASSRGPQFTSRLSQPNLLHRALRIHLHREMILAVAGRQAEYKLARNQA